MREGHKGRGKKGWIAAAAVVCVAAVVVLTAVVLHGKGVFAGEGGDEENVGQTKANTISLTKMNLTNSISATGTLESAKTKTVSADLNQGKVKSVKVSVGDKVKKGQTIVLFDTDELQDEQTEAEQTLADTKEQNSRQLTSAKRKLAEAKKEYKKATAGGKTGESSGQTSVESSGQTSVETAEDELAAVRASNSKSLREAQKAVDEAKEALAACTVKAPMGGTVTAVGVAEGDSYNGGDLVEISDLTDLQVSTTVSEYDISNVKKGQKVVILTDATGDTEIAGKISYVAMTTGSGLLSSGSGGGSESAGASGSADSSSAGYEVRIRLTGQEKELRAGMTAKCSIILKEVRDVYAVPYDAVHTNRDGDSVLYVEDESGGQSQVAVTKGMESDYYVEVSGDELRENLQVIIPTDEPSEAEESEDEGGLNGFMGRGMNGGDMAGYHGNKEGRGNFGGGAPNGAPGM